MADFSAATHTASDVHLVATGGVLKRGSAATGRPFGRGDWGRAIAWPVIDLMNPSKDVLALSPVEVDLSPVTGGMGITVVWQGKPIFVRHRAPAEIKEAQDVPLGQLIEPQPVAARVKAGLIRAVGGAAGSVHAMAASTTHRVGSAMGRHP